MPGATLRHVDPRRRRGRLYRLYASVFATRLMSWVSRRVAWKLDPHLLALSGGRFGLAMGLPTALLETRGARSGQRRRNGVIYFHDGEKVVVVASKQGLPTHPAWLHNLRATARRWGRCPVAATLDRSDGGPKGSTSRRGAQPGVAPTAGRRGGRQAGW